MSRKNEDPELVQNTVENFRNRLRSDISVPFLKTCRHCQKPLRSSDTIVANIHAFNSMGITDVWYYCPDHAPNPEDMESKTLAAVVLNLYFTLDEPSTNCRREDRSLTVVNKECDLPPAYDL